LGAGQNSGNQGDVNGKSALICIGGRRFRIASSASQNELDSLAERVESKLAEVGKGHPEGMTLAALALAHDAFEAEQRLRATLERQADRISELVARVDRSLGYVDENGNPLAEDDSAAKPEADSEGRSQSWVGVAASGGKSERKSFQEDG
jgi:cell division protein ZapA (FtsZ GTPase activity inhibitor)